MFLSGKIFKSIEENQKMGFTEIEAAGKKALEQFPAVKHAAKRVYQVASVVTNRDKVKAEGDITRVSPDDGYEYFYGYYDKSPWDATDRYMICVRVQQAYKSVAPKEPGTVCLIDTQDNNKLIEIGTTHSWNVQQSCMAQWMGPDFKSRIIYNDFQDGHYCSVIYNVERKAEEKVLPLPVYDVRRDGTFALSLDFNRLHRMRPGYGYSNQPDNTKGILCPDQTCIWKIDIETGEVTKLFKYTDFAAFEPDATMNGAEHKVNHLMISPNGKRFMVLHRWFDKGRKHTRLVTVNVDKTEMYNLSDDVFVSHCYWKNDEEILSFLRKKETGDHYYLMKDKTQEYRMYWPELNTDGHCSYSPDGEFIITDTYPNRKRIASVYLCTEKDNRSRRIARVFSPFKYDNDCRCDLHPRWNREGNKICIDSVHEGKRGLYVIQLEENKIYAPVYTDTPIKVTTPISKEEVLKAVDQYDYVSFDIFDTLLKRDVLNPHDIFALVQKEIEEQLNIKLDDFKEKRIEAEKKARSKKGKVEVSIQEIYSAFDDEIIRDNLDQIIRLEEEAELKASCTNPYINKIFHEIKESGKHILVISDMYLPEKLVSKILETNGFSGYEYLFLSSSIGKRKAEGGELFKYACNEVGIKTEQLIHIGDSKKSDYMMAKAAGCAAYLIEKDTLITPYFRNSSFSGDKAMQYGMLKSFCGNRPDHLRDEYYAFGYEVFGPLLKGFTEWLFSNIEANGIKKMYFFARDGLILKDAFDLLYGDCGIKSTYLKVSRRSLRVPQIWMHPEYEDVISSFPAASMQTIGVFFDTLGLEFLDKREICNDIGIDEKYTYRKAEMLSNEKLRKLYEILKPEIIENSKREYNALLKYLEDNEFNGNVAVVDIGWRGSMQKYLIGVCNTAGIEVEMQGYYIGLGEGAEKYAEELPIQFKGYAFDVVANPGSKDIRQPFVGLVETLFLARTGSTKRYSLNDNGQVDVELYDNEYEVAEGHLTTDAQKVQKIQDGGIDFIKKQKHSILSEVVIDSGVAFENLRIVGIKPNKHELNQFGDMEFIDGVPLKLAAPKSKIKYAIKPKSVIKDFYNSRWKIGFMKRFLKMPLPYGRIYDILKKGN